jgi:D-xylose transport system substrate-binding protein
VPIDAYVSFDNREVGASSGAVLLASVPRGRYLIVNGSVRDNNSYEVNAGLKSMIDPAVARKEIRVVDEIWLEEWSSDEALEKIGAVLERTTDIDAISCANDQIANAAIQLLAERQLAGKVAVVGQAPISYPPARHRGDPADDGVQADRPARPTGREIAVQVARGQVPNPRLRGGQ